MAQVTITINSREYAVACEDGQEVRIIQLARVLDEKARMITGGTGQISENMLLAMVGLLLADELNELKKGASDKSPAAADDGAYQQQMLERDHSLAEKIKSVTEQIKSVASHINLL